MAANKDYKTPDKNTVADANSTQDTMSCVQLRQMEYLNMNLVSIQKHMLFLM